MIKNLKKLREKHKLSQWELANAVQVSQYTIQSLETCRRCTSVDLLIRFAKFFNVSTDYLLGLKETEN